MKTYTQTENGFVFEGVSIPDSGGNRHYRKMIDEVESGDAEIVPYVAPPVKDLDIVTETQWRDEELGKANESLFAVQDGDGSGTVADWRTFRKSLRAYTEQPDFPYGTRPVL